MAKFSKNNFKLIIREIEDMEAADQNIWIPISLLEIIQEDIYGVINQFFEKPVKERDFNLLWEQLNDKR